ncbi:hypothetical protein SUGI_0295620 [Cryptomeria japonica]|uniref:BTB/POZ domain-containing protein At5g60050-like n=1 Tax=Cryptomeria japonica TaxID=3369 RepID=UPI002408C2A2|nr:BTB/POZ domain-containing protein At5g60050-like [Cryptomeria japonica]GLJ17092.1 hypothetical protein SUGI_0295620 [Cryptomeria japonica]
MAEGRLRFGTKSSADVTLFLTGPGEIKYGRNPVYLHSQILKRLKSFEGKFSDRWELHKSTDVWVTTSHNFDHYLKCIEIIYGEHVDFPDIEECLAILSVASEMSADECINKCMQYLEAVRWSDEEETQIRKLLSSDGLKLKILPDLAARFHQDQDDEHINFVEKSMQETVSLIKDRDPSLSRNRESVEKYLETMLDRNPARDVVDVCGRVLLQEYQSTINSRDFSFITLLFKLVQRCNGAILEVALKAFCEDAEFMEYVKKWYHASNIGPPVFDIIMWFMKATGDGKITISRASRVSFLTTWLPIMGSFKAHSSVRDKFEELDKAVLKVVESLPQVDQKRICVVWLEVYRLRGIDIATPYVLAQYLQCISL